MLVNTLPLFRAALRAIKDATIVVADTETNGLKPYAGNNLVGVAVYLPETDQSFYFPFFHGEGKVDIPYTKGNPKGTPLEDMTWQGRTKRRAYLSYWFQAFKEATPKTYFENLWEGYLDELIDVWGNGTYIFHNARFDLHFLDRMGFPTPEHVEDTMLALHVVNEDWQGVRVEAPYKNEAGLWVRNADGTLAKRWQNGNRQLKWQAAYHGFPGATEGEETLYANIEEFRQELTDFICNFPDHIYNEFAIKRGILNPDIVKSRVEVLEKEHLWMLPASKVSHYAELDVRLTWMLREWCLGVIKTWDNEKLYRDVCDIQTKALWPMEVNGFKLDRELAKAEIAKLEPRIAEIKAIIASLAAVNLDLDDSEEFNAGSNPQLCSFLNSGVLETMPDTSIFPEWWPVEGTLNLKTYSNVRLATVNSDAFQAVADHPVIRLIIEYRKMQKACKTYLGRWLNAADKEDIVRFSLAVDGTVTGRVASSGDAGNGQNIPDRGGYTIKRAIIPYSSEWEFIAIDYGQLELRLAAWIAEGLLKFDPAMTMTNLFLSGEDMHSYVRDMVGVRDILFNGASDQDILLKLGYKPGQPEMDNAPEVVAKYCRQVAKTMNFGLLYSGTEKMLSKLLSIELDPARELVRRWRTMFPAFEAAQEYYTNQALSQRPTPTGETAYGMYVTQPISGRHRKLHKYPNWVEFVQDGRMQGFDPKKAAARKCWNAVVQGLGGYLCTNSVKNYHEKYGYEYIRLFAQIHDAVDGYIRRDSRNHALLLAEEMTNYNQIIPNLTVDIQASVDGTWQGMRSIKDINQWVNS